VDLIHPTDVLFMDVVDASINAALAVGQKKYGLNNETRTEDMDRVTDKDKTPMVLQGVALPEQEGSS
jgi:hypothetical protein